MKRIILIGGGEIREKETLPIDREFIKLSGGSKAVIGFFPTAAGDSDGYIKTFSNYYQNLGCQKIIPIKLSILSRRECSKLIRQMTGIYLGGGFTEVLVQNLRKTSIDQLIKKTLENGLVVAGMSAGALAVCDYYIDPDVEPERQKVERGLGFQHEVLCIVHYQKERDEQILLSLKKDFPDHEVFAIKEKRAILIKGDKSRWLS